MDGGEGGSVPPPVVLGAKTADVAGSFRSLPAVALGGQRREDNSSRGDGGGGAAMAPSLPAVVPAMAAPSGMVAMGPASGSVDVVKKKRGRPRKYGPDGRPVRPLNPMPISASAPLMSGEYTPAAAVGAVMKRGRARALGLVSKPPNYAFELESSGEMVACAAGANFTPHIITVASGEDVTMKIISFSQQGPRAICILSANGIISNVTLRQLDSSGGTLTYEGRFELLSLSGSFMPTENEGTRSRSGGMSVSLASPDGRVVGGAVAGLLVAAGPVHVVVGSFLPSYQMEQKTKKPKLDVTSLSKPAPSIQIASAELEDPYGRGQLYQSSVPKSGIITSPSYRVETWAAAPLQAIPEARNTTTMKTDINITLPGG